MNYERLDELLKERKLSRRKLAIMAGIDPNKMSVWFSRKTKHVPAVHLRAIAKVLNVPLWELITIDGVGIMNADTSIENFIRGLISKRDEGQIGYSDSQLLDDFHRLSYPHKLAIIDQIELYLEEEGEEGNNGTGSERESQRNDHQG